MGKTEFARIMAYLSCAIGKSVSLEAAAVYYDLLGDLPVKALQSAVQRVALQLRQLIIQQRQATFQRTGKLLFFRFQNLLNQRLLFCQLFARSPLPRGARTVRDGSCWVKFSTIARSFFCRAGSAVPELPCLDCGRAAICVTVKDQSGKAVPGAHVTVRFTDVQPPVGPAPLVTDAKGQAFVGHLAEVERSEVAPHRAVRLLVPAG